MLTEEQRKKLLDAGYSETKIRAYEVYKNQSKPKEGGVGADIKGAFQGGLDYAKQGYEDSRRATNPLQKTEAGLKQIMGVAGAAFSPLAPVTKYIGKGIDATADVISDSKGVQKFAMSKAGQTTARVAEDVMNTSGALSMVTGAKGITTRPPKTAVAPKTPVVPKPPATAKPLGDVRSTVRDLIPTKQAFINEEVSKALDLSVGDLATISKATGNEVGPWLSENNLIGRNKAETQSLVDDFFEKNYTEVRKQVGAVDKVYKQSQIPRYVDALKQIQSKTTGVAGLEDVAVQVENLLNKKEVTLTDVQLAKELLDTHFNLYKVTGDVGEGVAKEGLSNIRKELRLFIESEVKDSNGTDVGKLNNNVSTAKSLSDAIIKREPKGILKSNLQTGDAFTFGAGWAVGGPLVGFAAVFVKKLAETPTVRLRLARLVDQFSDAQKKKIQAQLERGVIPEEFAPFVKQKWMVGERATRLGAPAASSRREPQKQPRQ